MYRCITSSSFEYLVATKTSSGVMESISLRNNTNHLFVYFWDIIKNPEKFMIADSGTEHVKVQLNNYWNNEHIVYRDLQRYEIEALVGVLCLSRPSCTNRILKWDPDRTTLDTLKQMYKSAT